MRWSWWTPPGLLIQDGNFFWAEPPPKPQEDPKAKKGGPPGAATLKRGGSFFRRAPSSKTVGAAAGEATPADVADADKEGAVAAETVAVELAGMAEEGEGGDTAGPSPIKAPKGNDLSDSALSGSPDTSAAPSPPPEKARAGSGKDSAWWLHDINLKVGGCCGGADAG